MPERIQLRRTKGWRKPEGAVVVARPSKWGNPVKVGSHVRFNSYDDKSTVVVADAAIVTALFRQAILTQSKASRERVLTMIRTELRGRDLACWCPLDQPCHADVLLELANGAPRV